MIFVLRGSLAYRRRTQCVAELWAVSISVPSPPELSAMRLVPRVLTVADLKRASRFPTMGAVMRLACVVLIVGCQMLVLPENPKVSWSWVCAAAAMQNVRVGCVSNTKAMRPAVEVVSPLPTLAVPVTRRISTVTVWPTEGLIASTSLEEASAGLVQVPWEMCPLRPGLGRVTSSQRVVAAAARRALHCP